MKFKAQSSSLSLTCSWRCRPHLAFAAAIKVDRNVAVPMRDGVVLRADVYSPDEPGPHPVLVLRTPYGRTRTGQSHTKAGYTLFARCPRPLCVGGKWESFYRTGTHDATDGYDMVEWAAKLPGSSGQLEPLASYNAFLQWRLAAAAAIAYEPWQRPRSAATHSSKVRARFVLAGG
jgi:predicted acyl esterase